MLFVSDFDVIPEPTRTIIMMLQLILGIGCIIIGFLCLISMKKKNLSISKAYFFGIPLFFMLVGIARLIFVYHDFFAPDSLDILLWAIAQSIVLSGFISMNYVIETFIYKKTKRIFTIIGIVLTLTYIILVPLDKFIATMVLYGATVLLTVPALIIYCIVAKEGAGVVRKKAIVILIGLTCMILAAGTGLYELIGVMNKLTASTFGPIMALVGLSILGYGFTMGEK